MVSEWSRREPTYEVRGSRFFVLALALILLAGCASKQSDPEATAGPVASSAPGSPAVSPEPSSHERDGSRAEYLGPVGETFEYADPGIVFEPPPAGSMPAISWTDAFEACFEGPVGCVTEGDAQVALALVTGPGTASVGGRQIFDRELAYVIIWDSVMCMTADGPTCKTINLVTAELQGELAAGTVVYAFQVPPTD